MFELWSMVEQSLGLGLDAHELSFWQMGARASVAYLYSLIILRVSGKRALGDNATFDFILAIVFGSIVSAAIIGESEFFPSLGTSAIVVLIHWGLAVATHHSPALADLMEGQSDVLVRNGQIDWRTMRRCRLGKEDLMTAVRDNGNLSSLEEVREARLERNGNISIIKQE